jgi:hypothetical protein
MTRRSTLALAVVLVSHAALAAPDPAKTVGAEKCGECHKSEYAAWKETTHYKTFNTLHRRPEAREVADKLGVKSLKREGRCVTCHYTAVGTPENVVTGVSCESCHGAARDWIDVHSDFGGKGVTAETEAPEHRAERLRRSAAAGFVSRRDVAGLASRCQGCHTVPDEELVNKGGHKAGSDFELVSWSQGEVRHNFMAGKENREPTAQELRLLFIVGQGAALEANLRGVAKGTQKADFAVAMARRVAATRDTLRKATAAARIPEAEEMLAAASSVALKLGNSGPLNAAADRVAAATRKLQESATGRDLAGLDALLRTLPVPKGQVFH